jgi:hypothetical protein
MGADPSRQRERFVAQVHGDHPDRRGDGEDLHGHVAEAPDADHDARGAGAQGIASEIDGVVRREPRVRERRRLRHVEIADGEQPCRRDRDVLRHPAVTAETDPAHRYLPTLVVTPAQARGAGAAPDDPVDRDRLTPRQTGDTRAERLHPAGVLVAERHR